MYGYGDNYKLDTSHVLPALIRKVYEARCAGRREVMVCGYGTPLPVHARATSRPHGWLLCIR